MNLKDLFTKPDAVSITKNTAQDKVRLLRDAIEHVFEVKGYQEWAYYEDHDESYIYFTLWYEPKEKYSQFKIAYTYNDHVVSLIETEASFVTKLTLGRLPTEILIHTDSLDSISLNDISPIQLPHTVPAPVASHIEDISLVSDAMIAFLN